MEGAKGTKVDTIKVIYKKSPDFKSYYVNGARGGFLGNYDLKLEFYSDRFVRPDIEYLPKKETSSKDELVLDRKVELELILSPVAAVELRRFLDKMLDNPDLKFKIEMKENES